VSQVSKWLRESDLIHKAYFALMRTIENNNCVESLEDDMDVIEVLDGEDIVEDGYEDIESKTVGKPLFIVNLDPNPNDEIVICLADKRIRAKCQLDPMILDFLAEQKDNKDYPLYQQNRIEIFTDYKQNGVTYRAHPNYNSFGEWYDWAMVKFESEDLSEDDDFGYYASDLYPAKVLCFVKAHDETIHAIIHCCMASDHSQDSCGTLEKRI